jgi:hypothetical protein
LPDNVTEIIPRFYGIEGKRRQPLDDDAFRSLMQTLVNSKSKIVLVLHDDGRPQVCVFPFEGHGDRVRHRWEWSSLLSGLCIFVVVIVTVVFTIGVLLAGSLETAGDDRIDSGGGLLLCTRDFVSVFLEQICKFDEEPEFPGPLGDVWYGSIVAICASEGGKERRAKRER